jgi:hypothetical protein
MKVFKKNAYILLILYLLFMKKCLSLLPVFLVSIHSFLFAADTSYYRVLRQGNVTGQLLRWKNNSNEYGYRFEYNDRGRGPSITTINRVDEKGNIIYQQIKGVDYFKSPVSEIFEVKNKKAYWKNKFENDSAVYNNEAYANIDGTPGESELLLKMFSNHSSHELSVLPAGKWKVNPLTSFQQKDSNNNLITVNLVSITGGGSDPIYLWAYPDNRFFASVSEWVSIIEAGFEEQADSLLTIQKKYEAAYFKSLAVNLTEKPSTGIAIHHVTVFEAQTGTALKDRTVLITQNRIEKTGPSASIKIPAGYKLIEGRGKFLMPGLWEMHGHFFKTDGPFMLARGVTNLRDMGNDLPELKKIISQVNEDSLLGPDINVTSGFIDKAGAMAAPTGALIISLEEGLKFIEEYKQQGCGQIKLYSSINPEWVKPLAAKAHSLGMRVCGHIPAFMTASQALDAGYDEITHLNMLLLNFFGDSLDTRNMNRFLIPGRKGYTIDVDGAAFQAFLNQLREKKTVLDPTINIFERMFTEMPGKISGAYQPMTGFLPAEIRRYSMAGGYIDKDSLAGEYAKSYSTMKKILKAIYDNGNIILAGTDGGILQHELEIYSECGIPNGAVLQTATYNPAKVSGLLNDAGTIEAGKIANMILIDGDPLLHIKDIRKIMLTIKEGRVYHPKAIYGAYGWGYYNY